GAGKSLALTAGIAYGFTTFSGILSYGTGSVIFKHILTPGSLTIGNTDNPEHALLSPLFTVEMPPLLGVRSGLMMAFILGIGISTVDGNGLKKVMNECQESISQLSTAIISPLRPVDVMGIFANMPFPGQVGEIIGVFCKVFLLVILLQML